eukprot:11179879-Lingulodinium_polyedra.AAC.1
MVSPRRSVCAGPSFASSTRSTLLMPRIRSTGASAWVSVAARPRWGCSRSCGIMSVARRTALFKRDNSRAARQ